MIRRVVMIKYEQRTSCPTLGAQAVVTLSCGHIKRMKASQAPRHRTKCAECGDRIDLTDLIDKDEAR